MHIHKLEQDIFRVTHFNIITGMFIARCDLGEYYVSETYIMELL